MTEELNPQDDSLESELNPKEDSEGDDDLQFLDELESEPEEPKEPQGSDESLNVLNEELKKRGLNKNYKSWDDVAKSEKQRDIDFAKKGMEKVEPVIEKKEVETEKVPINLSERLLLVEKPDSQFVMDDIKKEFPDKDPYEIWNKFESYRREAAIRAENERNKSRIANPSGGTEGAPDVDPVEQKFIENLPKGFQLKKSKK